MLTQQLISCIKREMYESGESFKCSLKPDLFTIEHIPTNRIYFVVWNPYRGGSYQVMPCQNSETYYLISRCVHKAVQIYNQQKAAKERKLLTLKTN